VGADHVITDERLVGFNKDWMNKFEGSSKVALRPRTTQEVSQILKHCNERRLAVVPQGGNTGLVGGSVPVFDEIVVSMARMNDIKSIDPLSGILVCQAGCILQTLDEELSKDGLMMPLDLGAKGSCHIGGNISTNAGGIRYLRYGSLHGSVLGLEVVLATGEVLDVLQTLRKDTTGYDLKQLFIGAEGTLGMVTAAAIHCPPRPSSKNVTFLQCADFSKVLETFQKARAELGEILSAFEFLDKESLELSQRVHEDVNNPLEDDSERFYMVVETSGSNEKHDYEKLEIFLESAMESGIITNGAVAQDGSQFNAFWRIREGIPEALTTYKAMYKYDLSIPLETMYDLVEEMRDRVGDKAYVVGYGHLGDGNLHLNVVADGYSDHLTSLIEPYVYEQTQALGGSVSAEHGLGQMKSHCIGYTKASSAVSMMNLVKKTLDPNGILNPYKVLPSRVSE
jgi:D-2-hydroxyglutarate dehydrogenase